MFAETGCTTEEMAECANSRATGSLVQVCHGAHAGEAGVVQGGGTDCARVKLRGVKKAVAFPWSQLAGKEPEPGPAPSRTPPRLWAGSRPWAKGLGG